MFSHVIILVDLQEVANRADCSSFVKWECPGSDIGGASPIVFCKGVFRNLKRL